MTSIDYIGDRWTSIVEMLPADLEQSASEWKALQRKREIKSAADLVRLALLYGFCDESLALTAAHAAAVGFADMSDGAVLDRLKAAAPWLGHVVLRFLQDRGLTTHMPKFRVRVVDATVISEPGSKGTDWRFHLGLDLAQMRLASVELTDAHGGEAFARHRVGEDEILLGDRGYAHRQGTASAPFTPLRPRAPSGTPSRRQAPSAPRIGPPGRSGSR